MDNTSLTNEIAELHAKLCSALADPKRLLLLYVLSERSLNVTELTQELGIPQSSISRHLKVLRDGGLVRASREGMAVRYTLNDQRIIEALDLLRAVLRDRIQHQSGLIDELNSD